MESGFTKKAETRKQHLSLDMAVSAPNIFLSDF